MSEKAVSEKQPLSVPFYRAQLSVRASKCKEGLQRLFPAQARYVERQGFGSLDAIPPEVVWIILSHLDLRSLSRVQRTCCKGKYLVETLPEARILKRAGARTIIEGLANLEILGLHSVSDLMSAMRSHYCACCLSRAKKNSEVKRKSGGERTPSGFTIHFLPHPNAKARHGFVFLPTLERMCVMCRESCNENNRFSMVQEDFATRYCGLVPASQMRFKLPWSSERWRFERGTQQWAVVDHSEYTDDTGAVYKCRAVSHAQIIQLALRKYKSWLKLNQVIWKNLCDLGEQGLSRWCNVPKQLDEHTRAQIDELLGFDNQFALVDRDELQEPIFESFDFQEQMGTNEYEAFFDCASEVEIETHESHWPWGNIRSLLVWSARPVHTDLTLHALAPFLDKNTEEVKLLRCWGCFVNNRARHLYNDQDLPYTLAEKTDPVELYDHPYHIHMERLLYTAAELRQHQKRCAATTRVREIMSVRSRIGARNLFNRGPEGHYMDRIQQIHWLEPFNTFLPDPSEDGW